MNHQKISEIIKEFSWYGCTYTLNQFCNELANYFEKEINEEKCLTCGHQSQQHYSNDGGQSTHCEQCNCQDESYENEVDFNKEQFLRDCGVKE